MLAGTTCDPICLCLALLVYENIATNQALAYNLVFEYLG